MKQASFFYAVAETKAVVWSKSEEILFVHFPDTPNYALACSYAQLWNLKDYTFVS